MLDKKHKLLELKTSALVDSLFIWNYKTKIKWKWIEFIDYKEYDYSDDVKNIDFLRSEKEWKTLVKLYEEERDLSVYFIIDLNRTFFSDSLKIKKIDIVYDLLYLIWFSAIKQWDKFWAYIFDSKSKKLNFAKKWKQNFINITKELEKFGNDILESENNYFNKIKNFFNLNKENFFYKNKNLNKNNNIKSVKSENKFTDDINTNIKKSNWIKYFNSLKIKNSLVFFLTDELDIDDKDLKVLWIKNDLIVCNIFNWFENNLNFEWVVGFNKWENNITLDLDNKNKVEEYIDLRNEKILNFRKKIRKSWWKYILLDETKNTYKEVSKLFRK